jgi:hypothetical protein
MRDISAIITGNIPLHRTIIYNLLIVFDSEYQYHRATNLCQKSVDYSQSEAIT